MSRIIQHIGATLTILGIIAYFFLYFFVDFYYSKFIADFIALIGLSFMAASTTPAAIRAIRNGIKTDRDQFIVSYWSIWAVILLHRVWIVFLGFLNNPEAHSIYVFFREGPISGFIAVLIGISAAFGAIAPFTGSTALQKRDLFIFTVAAGFSGIIAGIALGVFVVAGWTH